MDIIKELEDKFKSIDAKLNSKTNSTNQSFNAENDKIAESFSVLEDQYKNGLNEHRDEMLKQLINKRGDELQKVNLFKESKESDLKSLASAIKKSHLGFSRSLISAFESILSRTDLETHHDFCKLVKYSNFISHNTSHNITKNVSLYSKCVFHETHQISPSLLFVSVFNVISEKELDQYIAIINLDGKILHWKKINDADYFRIFNYKVNKTNIIAHDNENQLVEIYNFKLEIVHSFKLEQNFENIAVHNYDIVFYDPPFGTLSVFDYKTNKMSRSDFCLYGIKRKAKKVVQFYDLNAEFLFFFNRIYKTKTVFVYDRAEFSLLYKAQTNMDSKMIMCDSEFYLFHETMNKQMKIYTAGRDNLKEEGILENGKKFNLIFSSFHGKDVEIMNGTIQIEDVLFNFKN